VTTSVKPSWSTWHPHSRQDRQDVLNELEQVLASPHFRNSKRYPALLRYVVEASLAGNAEMLKERTLGIEVFDRPPSYDTNTDTMVRYAAGEVRKRLSLYYHEHQQEPAHRIEISLPPGSYMPEFRCQVEDPAEAETSHSGFAVLEEAEAAARAAGKVEPVPEAHPVETSPADDPAASAVKEQPRSSLTRRAVLAATFWAAAGGGVFAGRFWPAARQGAIDEFWAPVLEENHRATRLHLDREAGSTLICAGGVVFAPNQFPGTTTAGTDTGDSLISMESAMAISRITGRLERLGANVETRPSATTTLNTLRERSVVLMGGFNNEWTLRLLAPLRFHMTNHPDQRILDRDHPETFWARNPAERYSSADDYALIARFHDSTTNSLILAVAGIGRHGIEAATDFVTSQRSMEMLKAKVGDPLRECNLEVVLKIGVVEGKTGAPSIQAITVW
jgi:hypothetical protein